MLNSLHKKVELELIEIEDVGVCIRFSPLEHVHVIRTTQQDIDNFTQSLNDIIVSYLYNIQFKSTFF